VQSFDMGELTAGELHVVGGSWSGLLFENPLADYPLRLTWSFTIDFGEVRREYGSVAPSLTIEWVPAGSASWDSMSGQRYAADAFGDPIESSLYFFEHFRFDRVALEVLSQSSRNLDVSAHVAGDLDGLGVPELGVAAQVSFSGIDVQTDETGSDAAAASALLAQFLTIDGLVPRSRPHNVLFEPSG
jgi:hypothetical protein